jgi:CRISPR-associated protein Cas2
MSWYIVSYDIRDQKRLQRLHYHLKKEALALQKSVFLVKSQRLHKVKAIIKQYSKGSIDDVRLYPITHPNAIWAAGQQAKALTSLGIKPHADAPANNETFLQKLLPQLFKKKEAKDVTNR